MLFFRHFIFVFYTANATLSSPCCGVPFVAKWSEAMATKGAA